MVKWRHLGFLSLALGGILLSGNAFATTKFDIAINPVLSLELSTETVSIEADNNLHVGYVNLNVTSNNQTGFTATMTTSGESTGLEHITLDSEIPTLTSTTTDDNFPTNHWGYSLDDGESYNAVPALGSPVTVFTTEKANDFGQRSIHFGVKVDQTMPSGIYQNTILVTAIPNFVPDPLCNSSATTITDAVCMQDMNGDIISSMNLEEQYQLIDSRDKKTYFIAKLKDGKVWMTQNLDLDLDNTVTLTNENTDLNSITSWTPIRSTIDVASNMTTTGTSTFSTIVDWENDYNTPYSVNPGDVYFDGAYSVSICDYLTTANCEHFKNIKQPLNNEHGHVGNYYNWSAAVAGNDTSNFTRQYKDYEDSICPKGWRLPHGYGSASGNEFKTLNTAYGGNTDSDQVLIGAPLFFVRAGYIYSDELTHADYEGGYWSSTIYSSEYTYNVFFWNRYVNLANGYSDTYGLSVRCVAR